SYPIAIFVLFIAMICLGSWPNLQVASKSNFSCFYKNYSIGILFTSFIVFVVGILTSKVGFNELSKSTPALFALLAGVVWNVGNILLSRSINMIGMSVAFPIGVGIALVEGVITNYIKQPAGNAWFLFSGVFLLLSAIICDAFACYLRDKSCLVKRKKFFLGVLLSVLAGVLLGWTYRILMESMLSISPISAYSAFLFFSIGVFISTVAIFYLYNAATNGNKNRTSFSKLSIAAGVTWAAGFSCVLLASNAAGFAISDALSQGATLVAALWGVLFWKEFLNKKKLTLIVIGSFVLYALAICLIITSHYF
ncbi:GRP family sugar transporter, partial [Piscirickettsia salmonis]|uniref:GRP family sugar transporter n=2 Tax=Piscirickettsia salmonis TaxID=1238 RepID=UPI003EBB3FF6